MLGSGKYEPYLHQIQCAEIALPVSSNNFHSVSKSNTFIKSKFVFTEIAVCLRDDIYVSIVNKTLKRAFFFTELPARRVLVPHASYYILDIRGIGLLEE